MKANPFSWFQKSSSPKGASDQRSPRLPPEIEEKYQDKRERFEQAATRASATVYKLDGRYEKAGYSREELEADASEALDNYRKAKNLLNNFAKTYGIPFDPSTTPQHREIVKVTREHFPKYNYEKL